MKKSFLILIILTAVFFIAGGQTYAKSAQSIALTLKAQGDVQFQEAEIDSITMLKIGAKLDNGDWVHTLDSAFAVLIFTDDKSLLKLREKTEITIEGKRDENSSIAKRISMEIGELYTKVEQQRGTLQIATPTSVASVKGTRFWVVVMEDGTTKVVTLEGLVELMNRLSGEIIEIRPGEQGISDADGNLERTPTPPGETPEDPDPGTLKSGNIQIELENEEGRRKNINLEYQIEEDEAE